MARSELEKLLAVLGGVGRSQEAARASLVGQVLRSGFHFSNPQKILNAASPRGAKAGSRISAGSNGAPQAIGAQPTGDLGHLAAQVDQLQRAMSPAAAPVPVKGTVSHAPANSSGGIGKLVLSHFLGGSGLGSLVSGLIGLFGGGKPQAPPPLMKFGLPQAVSVEAGVTRKGQFVPVNYSQNGLPRSSAVEPAPPPPMDSRWFMDHSADIARAVKEAMLNSHSINDVVADL